MRLSAQKVEPELRKQIELDFAHMIADINTFEEARIFLHDFFNQSEITAFTKRLAVAYWLRKGKGYIRTKINFNVSSATVSKIKKNSKKPGFALAIRKMQTEEWANKWAERLKRWT